MNHGQPTYQKPPTSLSLNSRLLPVLVVMTAVMQLVDPYRGWMILLAGLGGAWLAAYLWALSLAQGLKLTREMRFGWAQVGDKLQERFSLVNEGLLPCVWVEIVDHSTIPGYQASRVTGVGGQSINRWYAEGHCARRGLYTLGPTTLQTGDPLGIYSVRLHYPERADLMVTPPVLPLPSIEVAPGGLAQEGRPRPNAPERTVNAAGVRDYAPGDSLRWVHWPTSARRDSLFVRLFDSTPSSDWWIILDANRAVQVGEGQASSMEHGVILTASLYNQGIQAGRRVGLVANGAELTWSPPAGGTHHRQEILRTLAMLKAGEHPLAELLARTPPGFGRMNSLVIITADMSGGWVDPLLTFVRRGVIPTVLLLDPISFGGEQDGSALRALLSDFGIAHTMVTRDLLDRPEAAPGRQGHWEWWISATGRALPKRRPRDTAWRKLS